MNALQKKSHEALLRVLNNIGVIGAILAAIADIIFVVIMVLGIDMKDVGADVIILFAVVNALIGILITFLLRYQGLKYAEIENEELCKKFYNKKAKEKKRRLSMSAWMTVQTIKDFIVKGCTTAFSIFGLAWISITGSKNPIQILITVATLVLFACFGLIGMNSAYMRFYNVQVPFMTLILEERNGEAKQGKGSRGDDNSSTRSIPENSQKSKTKKKADKIVSETTEDSKATIQTAVAGGEG